MTLPSSNITRIIRNGKEIVFWLKSGHEINMDNIIDVEIFTLGEITPHMDFRKNLLNEKTSK